jgi:ParB-like chromosome segregation protein Spo0J
VLLLALAENLHRTDLNPFEEASAFLRLMREYTLDLKSVATRTKKTESYISTRLALLSMPAEVQQLIATKQLGIQFVRALARISNGIDQTRYANMVVTDRLTQTELSALVRREREDPEPVQVKLNALTPQKARARLDAFSQWLKKVPAKIDLGKMNTSERAILAQACVLLETQARCLREFVGQSAVAAPVTRLATDLHADPRNHREEWPSGHVRRIHEQNRPSDEVLSRELGRSISAIRAMRSETKRK